MACLGEEGGSGLDEMAPWAAGGGGAVSSYIGRRAIAPAGGASQRATWGEKIRPLLAGSTRPPWLHTAPFRGASRRVLLPVRSLSAARRVAPHRSCAGWSAERLVLARGVRFRWAVRFWSIALRLSGSSPGQRPGVDAAVWPSTRWCSWTAAWRSPPRSDWASAQRSKRSACRPVRVAQVVWSLASVTAVEWRSSPRWSRHCRAAGTFRSTTSASRWSWMPRKAASGAFRVLWLGKTRGR